MLLCLAGFVAAQDLIYRRGSDVPVKATIIKDQGPVRSYQLYGSSDSAVFYVLTEKLDSIIYHDGNREVFMKVSESEPVPETNKNEYKNHLAGIDAAAWLYKNIRLSYEYFPFNPHLGFKASISLKSSPYHIEIWESENIDTDLSYHYRNFRGYSSWHGTLGCNYYYFKPGSFRALTGLHYLFGSYNVRKIITDNNNNIVGTEEIKRPISGLLLSTYLFWTLNEYLAVDVGLDIPMVIRPPMKKVVFTAEFLLSF